MSRLKWKQGFLLDWVYQAEEHVGLAVVIAIILMLVPVVRGTRGFQRRLGALWPLLPFAATIKFYRAVPVES